MDRSAMGADVVVVDDDPRVRKVLGYLLEREGLVVRSYGSAHAALDFVLAHPPPVLVTDLQMPGLDGAGLAAAVRGGLGERSPRILLLTGNPRALRPRDKQLFDLTLAKPWEPSFLTSAVLSWVRAPHRPVAATG